MAARLRRDVARLVGEPLARRVDPLAVLLEDGGHRVLGEPVDLEVRVELAQLGRDRNVALGVAEADRRGDVERPPPARQGPWSRSSSSILRRAGRLLRHGWRRPRNEPTKSRISRLALTGWRPWGKWPDSPRGPRAIAISRAPRARPDAAGRRHRGHGPGGSNSGPATERLDAFLVLEPRRRWLAINVSASVRGAQPTASSSGFVECGSVKHFEKKNSRKSS